MTKDELDQRREDIALRLSGTLIGTGIHVCGGGRKGPYTVIINRLNLKKAKAVIGAILTATGRSMRPEGADNA